MREMTAHDGRIVQVRMYSNGNTGILVLEPDGEPFAKLSINVDGIMLSEGEFVLSHDCNRLVDWIDSTGMFERTGSFVDYGFVTGQPVYRVKDVTSDAV